MGDTLPVVLDARVVTGAGGGPEKTILNSPRVLTGLGYRMLCAYLHPPGDPGIEVLRQKANQWQAPFISLPDRGPWDWRVVAKLRQLCRNERVAIWHGHDYKSNALGLLLKRFWPMRLVTTVHGWVRHTQRTPLYYRIDKWCLRRYETVFCVSDDLVEECAAAGVSPGRCVLLENGIDLAEYQRTQSVADAKAKLGFAPDRPVVGAVGRLSPEKGFDILIEALDHLKQRGIDVQLIIVGEGDDRARLQAMLEQRNLTDRCRLAGFQTDPRPFFEAMDLFALSSLREGLPNVVLEAMALTAPVVATRIAGVPKLIADGRTGRLVEPGNATDLAGAMAEVLADHELANRLAQAGRAHVEQNYDFAKRMQRLAGFYDATLRTK